jgi:hypothetical protein
MTIVYARDRVRARMSRSVYRQIPPASVRERTRTLGGENFSTGASRASARKKGACNFYQEHVMAKKGKAKNSQRDRDRPTDDSISRITRSLRSREHMAMRGQSHAGSEDLCRQLKEPFRSIVLTGERPNNTIIRGTVS